MMLLTILVLILAISIVAALLQSGNCLMERRSTLNRPQQEVFNDICLFKHLIHFNTWPNAGRELRSGCRDSDRSRGFAYTWDCVDNYAGRGKQKILAKHPEIRLSNPKSVLEK